MITLIPFGKENKVSKESIIKILNITETQFNENLRELRNHYIILSDSTEHGVVGFYRPLSHELREFKNKQESRLQEIQQIVKLCEKEGCV